VTSPRPRDLEAPARSPSCSVRPAAPIIAEPAQGARLSPWPAARVTLSLASSPANIALLHPGLETVHPMKEGLPMAAEVSRRAFPEPARRHGRRRGGPRPPCRWSGARPDRPPPKPSRRAISPIRRTRSATGPSSPGPGAVLGEPSYQRPHPGGRGDTPRAPAGKRKIETIKADEAAAPTPA